MDVLKNEVYVVVFIDGTTMVKASIPVWQFVPQQMVPAVLYTWLHNNTSDTLLMANQFHTVGNTSIALLPPYLGTGVGRWVNISLPVITVMMVLIWGLAVAER